ncbi:MAG TPA: 16S rRNA (adenine(1518)-N(6)/adenine(1519)-N(6))-dimethyltransferase RsmA [Acidimicrobiia bacterium]|nr:16S rRNA (adenine(1518)-N(6)/adenine(1519)-N(6))-dimethyltransferase RsmA [Acidimicrobiia bacterium]
MSAQTRTEIADLLVRHGLTPKHHLGQHFLADPNITRKIVAISGVVPGDSVVEVGAGTGTLTRALAETGARVVSYEIDERLRPVLAETLDGLDVDLRFEDVGRIDLGATLEGPDWALVANLPYNVGTPLVLDTLRHVMQVTRFVVMVQKEVARRFVAIPGTPAYGLPSVITQIHSSGSLVSTIPPQVFYPPPRVESAVVAMERVAAPPQAERAIELARAGFGQRRKMLRGSLVALVEDPVALLEGAGIDPTSRAEQLSAADYLRLAAS